jgi:hypothetical protein
MNVANDQRLADERKIEVLAQQQAREALELISLGQIAFEDAVGGLADAGATFGLAKLIATRLKVPVIAVAAVLADPNHEAVTAMCRAANLKIEAYSAVLRMRRRLLVGCATDPAQALSGYGELTGEAARQMLRAMRLAPRPING